MGTPYEEMKNPWYNPYALDYEGHLTPSTWKTGEMLFIKDQKYLRLCRKYFFKNSRKIQYCWRFISLGKRSSKCVRRMVLDYMNPPIKKLNFSPRLKQLSVNFDDSYRSCNIMSVMSKKLQNAKNLRSVKLRFRFNNSVFLKGLRRIPNLTEFRLIINDNATKVTYSLLEGILTTVSILYLNI